MTDFTRSELLEICNWAMSNADRYYKMRFMSHYETAKSIFEKANNEYAKTVKG